MDAPPPENLLTFPGRKKEKKRRTLQRKCQLHESPFIRKAMAFLEASPVSLLRNSSWPDLSVWPVLRCKNSWACPDRHGLLLIRKTNYLALGVGRKEGENVHWSQPESTRVRKSAGETGVWTR